MGDPWINIICVIFFLTYLFLSNLSCAVGWPTRGLGTPNRFWDCTVWLVPVWFYSELPSAASCGRPSSGLTRALSLLISGSGPKDHGTHNCLIGALQYFVSKFEFSYLFIGVVKVAP